MQQCDLRSIWTGACVVSWMGHEIITLPRHDSLGPPIHFTELKIRPEKLNDLSETPRDISQSLQFLSVVHSPYAALSSTELLMETLFLKI